MVDVRIGPATIRDVSYILANLDPADAEEIGCQVPEGAMPGELAAGCVRFGSSFVAYLNGVPAMAFGSSPLTAVGNVRSAWAFGTRRSRVCMRSVMRFCRDEFVPSFLSFGVTRVEARSISTHAVAHRWLEAVGAEREATIAAYGKNGEDFVLYVWRPGPQAAARLANYCR